MNTKHLTPTQLRIHNAVAAIMCDNFGIPHIDTNNSFHRGLYLGLMEAYEAGVKHLAVSQLDDVILLDCTLLQLNA